MGDTSSTTPGWNPYGTPVQPWSPWLPKDQRSPLDTAKSQSLSNTPGPDTTSTFSLDNFGFTEDGLTYTGAENVTLPVLYFSNGVGGYLADPGSPDFPITVDAMAQSIVKSKMKTPGDILKLKQTLVSLNYIPGKSGQLSLSRGDEYDSLFYAGLTAFLNQGSIANLKLTSQGKKPLTLDQWTKIAPSFTGGLSTGDGSGGVRTSFLYQKFEPEDFEIPVDALFQSTLGRGASQDELNDFVAKLNAYAQENPQKTVTNVSGNTTSSTTTGGVSNQQIETRLRDVALNTTGAEEYNKATKYLNFFTEALSSPVRLG